MSDLDAKLREKLRKAKTPPDTIEGAITEIKQAFADAGYVLDLPKITDATVYPLIWAKAHGYMTGQEWYEQFKKELYKFIAGTDYPLAHPEYNKPWYLASNVFEAAKRAANIQDEDKQV